MHQRAEGVAGMPEGALAAVFRSTGMAGQGPNTVSFTGGADPLLPTPFRISAAGAAAIAAAGLAAAELWEQRNGRPQTGSGDVRPAPLVSGTRPLSDIRVLGFTRPRPGPIAGRTLAEHGADVLKITAPNLPHLGYRDPDTGHGKLSALLDLRVREDA